MKPVNLLPGDAPAIAIEATSSKPNMGMVGGAAAGLIAIVGVAGYFAMARVDSVKSETVAAQQQTQQATEETAAVRSQVQSLGQPVVDSDRQLAQGTEQVLIAAYTERHDFVYLSQELRAIMENTGGWYESVTASSAGGDDSKKAVEIVGYMPTAELAATFNERAKGTKSLANAEAVGIKTERLTDLDTKRPGVYYRFTVTADLVDIVAPSANDGASGSGGSDGTGTVVGSSSGGSGEITLSLDPEPKQEARSDAAPATPAKPRNPFDVAAAAAGRGGGS